MPDSRKPLIYGAFPVCRNYTVRAHICHVSPAKRRGRQNRQQHAGPLRCGFYSPHLHPRHKAEAGRSRPNHGQLHDAGDGANLKEMSGRNIRPLIFCPFRAFPRVGHGVGQAVDPHFDPHLKVYFATKKHRKPKFSMLFGAAGRIRTADLILTKDALYRLSYSSIWRPRWGSNPRPPA